jgi:phenylalanyl-tRNA synthetase beta subunit
VLEVNATPNRGDCMSVFGIARDYAAAQERRYLTATRAPVAAAHAMTFPGAHRIRERLSGVRSRVIRGVRHPAAIARLAARAPAPRRLSTASRRSSMSPIT